MSQTKIVRLESGKALPSAEDLAMLFDALDASVNEQRRLRNDAQTLLSMAGLGVQLLFRTDDRSAEDDVSDIYFRSRHISLKEQIDHCRHLYDDFCRQALWGEECRLFIVELIAELDQAKHSLHYLVDL